MTRKPTKKVASEVCERVSAMARVQRPALLAFMLEGFWALPELSSASVKDAATRTYYHGNDGWIIPDDSLGRKGAEGVATVDAARSTSESIRIWIGKNLPDVVSLSNVAVTVESLPAKKDGEDDQIIVALYRKA